MLHPVLARGQVTHTEVCLGAIKSCRRFTYEEVDEYLADRAGLEKQTHAAGA